MCNTLLYIHNYYAKVRNLNVDTGRSDLRPDRIYGIDAMNNKNMEYEYLAEPQKWVKSVTIKAQNIPFPKVASCLTFGTELSHLWRV